jgi:hypothetical protein
MADAGGVAAAGGAGGVAAAGGAGGVAAAGGAGGVAAAGGAGGVAAAGGAGGVAPAGRLATAAAPTIPAGAWYFDFTIRPGTLYDPFSGVDLCDEKGGAYSGIGGKRGPRRKIPVWRS